MKLMFRLLLFLLTSFILGFSDCSSSSGTLSHRIIYEGRFSKIENLPGFEAFDAEESMFKYNATISSKGNFELCDLICKLKAANVHVIVPIDESRISPFDMYLLKVRLLKDLSMNPVESFIENSQILEAAIKMIEFHLFYRIDEYTRYLREVVSIFPALEAHEHHEHEVMESAWNPILKPIYVILGKLINASNSNKGENVQLDSLIPSIVKLISSPIDEESRMASNLVSYKLFNHPDSVVPNSIINNLESIIIESLKGDIPLLSIGPILQFIGDIIFPCYQRGRDHFVTTRIISLIKNRLLSLPSHVDFVWICDHFIHLAIQYFSFFEVSSGKSIKRSPFEPVFPEESPFEDSEQVVFMRHILLTRNVDDQPQSIVNQVSRLALLHQLSMYQFYPRSMIPEIFELIRSAFIQIHNIDSALHLYSFITKPEIYRENDDIAQKVKDGLKSIPDALIHCEGCSQEMKTICRHIQSQNEVIDRFSMESNVKNQFESNRDLRSLIIS